MTDQVMLLHGLENLLKEETENVFENEKTLKTLQMKDKENLQLQADVFAACEQQEAYLIMIQKQRTDIESIREQSNLSADLETRQSVSCIISERLHETILQNTTMRKEAGEITQHIFDLHQEAIQLSLILEELDNKIKEFKEENKSLSMTFSLHESEQKQLEEGNQSLSVMLERKTNSLKEIGNEISVLQDDKFKQELKLQKCNEILEQLEKMYSTAKMETQLEQQQHEATKAKIESKLSHKEKLIEMIPQKHIEPLENEQEQAMNLSKEISVQLGKTTDEKKNLELALESKKNILCKVGKECDQLKEQESTILQQKREKEQHQALQRSKIQESKETCSELEKTISKIKTENQKWLEKLEEATYEEKNRTRQQTRHYFKELKILHDVKASKQHELSDARELLRQKIQLIEKKTVEFENDLTSFRSNNSANEEAILTKRSIELNSRIVQLEKDLLNMEETSIKLQKSCEELQDKISISKTTAKEYETKIKIDKTTKSKIDEEFEKIHVANAKVQNSEDKYQSKIKSIQEKHENKIQQLSHEQENVLQKLRMELKNSFEQKIQEIKEDFEEKYTNNEAELEKLNREEKIILQKVKTN